MNINASDSEFQGENCQATSRINAFFKQFEVGKLVHRCRITKAKGTSTMNLLATLFALPFLNQNLYRGVVSNKQCTIGKDAFYEFMRSHRFSWRRFCLLLASKACAFINSLTSDERETVLIIDDSVIHRPRARKVELAAHVYDHCLGRTLKGFRMLSLCWSDGASLVPLDFALLSSIKKKMRIQDVTKALDKRSCGYKRRQEAMTKAPDLLDSMIERALAAGIEARYVLFDSWFGMPAIISKVRKHLPVICMVKKTSKVHYVFEGEKLSIRRIYRRLKKRPGRAKVLCSAAVTMSDGETARLVFVRDRRKKDWLALLSTDIDLPESDVVRIYGKRWDIEVFFRTCKQHLALEKGCQARDFDALIAHTTIVHARYIFLSLEQRRHDDSRTLGLLFHACCEEVRDLDYFVALQRILKLAINKLRLAGEFAEDVYQAMADAVLNQAIDFFGLNRQLCQRT